MRKIPKLVNFTPVLPEDDITRERSKFISHKIERITWMRIRRPLFEQIPFMRREIVMELKELLLDK